MNPDLRCYYHPGREATGQCDRCGDYLCGECLREYCGDSLCGRCYRELTRPEVALDVGKAATVSVAGALPVTVMGVFVSVLVDSPGPFMLTLAISTVMLFASLALCAGTWQESDVRARPLVAAVSRSSAVFLAECLLVLLAVAVRSAGPVGTVLGAALWTVQILIVAVVVPAACAWPIAVKRGVRPLLTVILSGILIAGELVGAVVVVSAAFVALFGA